MIDREKIKFEMSEEEFCHEIILPLVSKEDDDDTPGFADLVQKSPMFALLLPVLAHDIWDRMVEFQKSQNNAGGVVTGGSSLTNNIFDVFNTGRE